MRDEGICRVLYSSAKASKDPSPALPWRVASAVRLNAYAIELNRACLHSAYPGVMLAYHLARHKAGKRRKRRKRVS